MRTLLLDALAQPDAALDLASALLRGGGIVAFPTETVYGLGALGLDPTALERIFVAKGRPHSDPLILHVAQYAWLRDLASEVSPAAERLISAFWPGPLTLVLPKQLHVPDAATAGLPSVAVRMPRHPVALELLRRVGAPLAAPSANLFTRPSPTTAAHVLEDLDGRIDAVLDAGPTEVGVESTVLDLRGPTPVLLRPGGVSRQALEGVLGEALLEREDAGEAGPLPSPGLLERHYSPRAEVRLFTGEPNAVASAMRREVGVQDGTSRMAILAYSEDLPLLVNLPVRIVELGPRAAPETVARTLFAALRQLDAEGVEVILTATTTSGGLGDALNDRLRRAAAGRLRSIIA
jgi:L-threonylcarbamoyladenylate synthase